MREETPILHRDIGGSGAVAAQRVSFGRAGRERIGGPAVFRDAHRTRVAASAGEEQHQHGGVEARRGETRLVLGVQRRERGGCSESERCPWWWWWWWWCSMTPVVLRDEGWGSADGPDRARPRW
jgi:hypothetical protein